MRYTSVDGVAYLVNEQGKEEAFRVSDIGILNPLNQEQRMALHAILNPNNTAIVLEGEMGTGKTAIATIGFLWRMFQGTKNGKNGRKKHFRLAYTRLHVPMGMDMGFLPGNKDMKFEPFVQPFFDQLELLPDDMRQQVNTWLSEGRIFFPPISYIKGRTLRDTLLIVDETQDLEPKIVEALLARMGANSVVAFIGDRYQIDTHTLTPDYNGLVHVAQLALSEPDVAYVHLRTPVRGRGAELALKLRGMRLDAERKRGKSKSVRENG